MGILKRKKTEEEIKAWREFNETLDILQGNGEWDPRTVNPRNRKPQKAPRRKRLWNK